MTLNRKLLKGINIITGKGNVINNTDILIENGLIKEIGDMKSLEYIDTLQVLDLKGKTIMPGIIDTHVHILFEPIGNAVTFIQNATETEIIVRAVKALEKCLKAGITYLRDLGGMNYIDIHLRDCIKKGLITGPDMLVSGKFITMTGGHGWQFGRECDGIAEVIKGTREQLKAGVDVIKIMATGGVMTKGVDPGSPQLSKEELSVAVIEAKKAGRRVASHAQGLIGIKNAIEAGVNSIEHGIYLDDEAIDMMLERGTYLVPTLSAVKNIIDAGEKGTIPEYIVEKTKRVSEIHARSFEKARKAGVKIAMGTDAGTPYNIHGNNACELKLMVDYGMTPMESIIASTNTSSELLGIENSYGTIEVGKLADIVVLDKSPLEDINAVLNIKKVFKNGLEV